MSDPQETPDLCVAIVACNAERTIERTLRSVEPIARRVVVYDSGSTDRTPDLCRTHGAEVVERRWEGYAIQKQLAMEHCDAAWVLSMDSDESLDEQLIDAVRRVVCADDPEVAGYAMNRRVWFDGRELRHVWQPEWRTRLVRPATARWTGYEPHPYLEVDGVVRRLPGTMRHDAFASISDMLSRHVGHGLTTAQSYYEMGRRGSTLKLAVSPLAAVLKQLVIKRAFLDGWMGWAGALATGVYVATKQMRLLELHAAAERGP